MTQPELLDLLTRFFDGSLDDQGAFKTIGPPSHADEAGIHLDAADARIALAHIEHHEQRLAGVSISFREALHVEREALEARFGALREDPRKRYHDPPRMRAAVEAPTFEGYLLLELDDVPEARELAVRAVVARRIPTGI